MNTDKKFIDLFPQCKKAFALMRVQDMAERNEQVQQTRPNINISKKRGSYKVAQYSRVKISNITNNAGKFVLLNKCVTIPAHTKHKADFALLTRFYEMARFYHLGFRFPNSHILFTMEDPMYFPKTRSAVKEFEFRQINRDIFAVFIKLLHTEPEVIAFTKFPTAAIEADES